jgi:pantoate--beta-alanine ligase
MKVLSKIVETIAYVSEQRKLGKTIGFVPTMGALHQGHLSLMRQAKKENDLLIVSIFVNPIQFNNKSDLKKYPRNIESDGKMLDEVECDILFAPTAEEMYPEPINKKYDFGKLGDVMEGANRPGHFNGVAIVVKKLFEICLPHKAYFGEKDFQQLAIINKLVKMENMDLEIIPCPIVREKDGLAMSSRNTRLSDDQRKQAPIIYKTLLQAKEMAKYSTVNQVKNWVENEISTNNAFQLEYFNISDDIDLQSVSGWNHDKNTMGFIVVNMGNVRLIDNIRLFNSFADAKGVQKPLRHENRNS